MLWCSVSILLREIQSLVLLLERVYSFLQTAFSQYPSDSSRCNRVFPVYLRAHERHYQLCQKFRVTFLKYIFFCHKQILLKGDFELALKSHENAHRKNGSLSYNSLIASGDLLFSRRVSSEKSPTFTVASFFFFFFVRPQKTTDIIVYVPPFTETDKTTQAKSGQCKLNAKGPLSFFTFFYVTYKSGKDQRVPPFNIFRHCAKFFSKIF